MSENKKNLIQINTVANSGSTGRIAEGIGFSARTNGFESYIAYGRWSMPSESHLIRIGSKADYLWHGIESRGMDNHGLGSRRATRAFLNTVDKISPGIVHLHNIHGYYLNYPLLFEHLKKKNIPVVWTLHDCWTFTGHCVYFEYVNCDKWKNGCFQCPQKKTYPASYIFDRSKQNWLDKKHYFTLPERMVIVPCSHWLGDLVKESFLGKYPVKVIHNGIDTSVFRPYPISEVRAKYGWEGQKILLGVASVWSARKGLQDFIKLAEILPEDYRIVLVGLNDKQINGLPANITAYTRTESVQMLAELYSAADVFLNLTWEDNFPTTNLEAISCGTPVITYRTGGSPESVIGDTGLVVEQGDLQGVLRAIPAVRKDVDICRNHALKYFRQEDCFKNYIDLYDSLLNTDL